jgi:NTE family protein
MDATVRERSQPVPLRKPVSLALQGGGAWGAYTWGVLDALLASRRIAIDQISGTSAGALNGAVLASAFGSAAIAGRQAQAHEMAREALEAFWRALSQPDNPTGFLLWQPFAEALRSSVGQWMWANGLGSPYATQAPGANPLREVIARHIDVEAIRSDFAPALYVTVTNVRTGLPRIIANAEMSVEALAASACLPQLFQAVELDGEPYWDGGYAGNPTLWPLIRHRGRGRSSDVILVQLTPDYCAETPQDATAINRRVGEIMFNSSLVAEMQAIAAIREAAQGAPGAASSASPFVSVRMHRIGPPPPELLEQGSADQRSWTWLTQLRDEGRAAARVFLKRHADSIGRRETLDIARIFQSPQKPRIRMRGAARAANR